MVTYMSSDPPAVHTTAFGYEFTRPDIYVPSLSVAHGRQTGISTTSSARRTALTGSPTRHPDVAAFTSSDPPAVHTTGFGYSGSGRTSMCLRYRRTTADKQAYLQPRQRVAGVDGKQPYSPSPPRYCHWCESDVFLANPTRLPSSVFRVGTVGGPLCLLDNETALLT